jgi:hypothetical protein
MVSFAFKNVVLFVIIIIIVHVLLKNAIVERDRSIIRSGGVNSTDTTKPSSTAHQSTRNRPASSAENEDALDELLFKDDEYDADRKRRVEEIIASVHKKTDEEDMLRYIEGGEDDEDEGGDMITNKKMTPSLTASWNAHRLPVANNSVTTAALPYHSPSPSIPVKKGRSSSRYAVDSDVGVGGTSDCVVRKYSNESPMNGGRLFAGEAEADNGGLTGANAFDTNYQTFD